MPMLNQLRAVATVALLGACGSPSRDTNGSDTARGGRVAGDGSSSAVALSPTGCRLEGDWTPCAVADRFAHAGVVATPQPDSIRHPFFSVAGIEYFVGNPEHRVQVFLFPSAEIRARETAALDSVTAAPPGQRVTWRTPPTLVVSQNLAAVVLSVNDRTVERLSLALGAGLPQPAKR